MLVVLFEYCFYQPYLHGFTLKLLLLIFIVCIHLFVSSAVEPQYI